jgi:hypothetical protein
MLFFVLAILLYVTNLLSTSAIPSLVRSKGGLAFLGDIAQSFFVEGCPLATQAYK